MRKKLSKREVESLERLANRISTLRARYDDENGSDVELQIKSNGTVGECLSVASAAIETILQEYY